jgi:hypothetical protein
MTRAARALHTAILALAALLSAGPAQAQREAPPAAVDGQSATELAKQAQNPIADLISVPFQNNFNFGAGTDRSMIWVMNFQPVIPIHLNEDWLLITRTIVPIINQPALFPGSENAFGMGDINPSLFFSPAKPRRLIWGIGPTMTFPTASESELGAGNWSMGPTAVALLVEGHWVVGALVNHQWSYAGWSSRDTNQMLIEPFVNYNLADGWYLSSSPIITGNFSAGNGDHWTVPIGGGVGRVWRLGKIGLPLNTQIVPYYNVAAPDLGPDWQLRFQFQLLFPE